MSLPSSGQLSFSAIANILNLSLSNVSLRSMSAQAGFSTPDAVSEFYGYNPVVLTEVILRYETSSRSVCTSLNTDRYWVNNVNFSSGTILYANPTGTVFAANGFYSDGSIFREVIGGDLRPAENCPIGR